MAGFTREELKKLTDEFLANGGEITKCPTGKRLTGNDWVVHERGVSNRQPAIREPRRYNRTFITGHARGVEMAGESDIDAFDFMSQNSTD